MRSRTTVFFVVTTLALLAGIFLFREGQAKHGEGEHKEFLLGWSTVLPVGSPLPGAVILLDQKPTNLADAVRGSWTLVLLTGRFNPDRLTYPKILANLYSKEGFRVVNVLEPIPANHEVARSQPTAANIDIGIDTHRAFAKILKLADDQADYVWTLLVDPSGVVVFTFPNYVAPDDLRQLAARYLGPTTRAELTDDGFATGRRLPAVELIDARDANPVGTLARALGKDGGWVIFFRANCTTCGVDTLIGKLAALKAKGVDFEREHIVPVFSSAFEANALRLQLRKAQDAPKVFAAASIVASWEDPYLTRVELQTLPKVARIDRRGVIVSSEPFEPWYKARSGTAAPVAALNPLWRPLEGAQESNIGWARDIAPMPGGGFALLDSRDHRILQFDAQLNRVRAVGTIGQEKGDLYLPFALSTTGGRFTVADAFGLRIKRLTFEGREETVWPFPGVTDSIAVTGDGTVYASSPRDQAVAVSVLPDGKIGRKVGRLVDVREVYPTRKNAEELRVPLSRAWLKEGPGGNLIAAFQFLPLVRAYRPDGRLLWQHRLSGPAIDALSATFWKEEGAAHAKVVKSLDGQQFPLFITAATVDDAGRTWVSLGDGSLVVIDAQGRQVTTLRSDVLPKVTVWWAILVRQPDVVLCSSGQCFAAKAETLWAATLGARPRGANATP